MANQHTWFVVMNVVFNLSVSLVLLTIVTIGWLRHRRMGFLLLIGYGLTALSGSTLGWFSGVLQPFLRRLFPNADQFLLMVMPQFGVSIVTSIFLLTGLALLVFRVPAVEQKFQRSSA